MVLTIVIIALVLRFLLVIAAKKSTCLKYVEYLPIESNNRTEVATIRIPQAAIGGRLRLSLKITVPVMLQGPKYMFILQLVQSTPDNIQVSCWSKFLRYKTNVSGETTYLTVPYRTLAITDLRFIIPITAKRNVSEELTSPASEITTPPVVAQPTPAVVTQPTPIVETQSTPTVVTERTSTPTVAAQQTPPVVTQPTPIIETQSIPTVVTERTPTVETQLIPAVVNEPTLINENQPTPTVTTQRTLTPTVETQLIPAVVNEPTLINENQPTPTVTTQRTLTPTVVTSNPEPIVNQECGSSVTMRAVNQMIVRGVRTYPGEFPWLVAIFILRLQFQFQCAGSLVSNTHVITAAHCFEAEQGLMSASFFHVSAGRYRLRNWRERGSANRNLREYRIHPDYKPELSNVDADLAVVVLSDRIEFTPLIQPICLWSKNSELSEVVGKSGYVIGWGEDESGSIYLEEPRMSRQPIVSQEDCLRSHKAFWTASSRRTFCAGARDGSGPCNGDSGSGLVLRDAVTGRFHLRGVVSLSLRDAFSMRCDMTQYILYVDVAKHLKWLTEQIAT